MHTWFSRRRSLSLMCKTRLIKWSRPHLSNFLLTPLLMRLVTVRHLALCMCWTHAHLAERRALQRLRRYHRRRARHRRLRTRAMTVHTAVTRCMALVSSGVRRTNAAVALQHPFMGSICSCRVTVLAAPFQHTTAHPLLCGAARTTNLITPCAATRRIHRPSALAVDAALRSAQRPRCSKIAGAAQVAASIPASYGQARSHRASGTIALTTSARDASRLQLAPLRCRRQYRHLCQHQAQQVPRQQRLQQHRHRRQRLRQRLPPRKHLHRHRQQVQQ